MIYRILINGGGLSGLEDRPVELLEALLRGLAP